MSDNLLFAHSLFTRHRLTNWSLAFTPTEAYHSLCRYAPRVIELSTPFIEKSEQEAIRAVLLHEVAHALVGPGHAHNALWRAAALLVGASPVPCVRPVDGPPGPWKASCPSCSTIFSRKAPPRARRAYFCRSCGHRHGRLEWAEILGKFPQTIG